MSNETAPNNVELKDVIDMIFNVILMVEDISEKSYFKLLEDIVKTMGSLPGLVSNFGDLKSEINALLMKPENQVDLLTYAESQLPNVANPEIQGIVKASLKTAYDLIVAIEDIFALKKAIQNPPVAAVSSV